MAGNRADKGAAQPSSGSGIRTGMMVEVLTPGNQLIFVGKVLDYQKGTFVIQHSRGDDLPAVLYNKEVWLRFYKVQGNTVIQGKICGSTKQFWKIDRLKIKSAKEQRAFFRQNINGRIKAMCARLPGPGKTGQAPVPCQIMDISAGGVQIESREEYQVMDRLFIAGLQIIKEEEPFNLQCRVLRVTETDLGLFRYGCQIESLSTKEQDRLLRAIFAVQREEIKKKR